MGCLDRIHDQVVATHRLGATDSLLCPARCTIRPGATHQALPANSHAANVLFHIRMALLGEARWQPTPLGRRDPKGLYRKIPFVPVVRRRLSAGQDCRLSTRSSRKKEFSLRSPRLCQKQLGDFLSVVRLSPT